MGVVELKPFHIGIWHYLVKKTGPQPSFTGQKCASLSTEESSDVLQTTSMVRVITKVLLQLQVRTVQEPSKRQNCEPSTRCPSSEFPTIIVA